MVLWQTDGPTQHHPHTNMVGARKGPEVRGPLEIQDFMPACMANGSDRDNDIGRGGSIHPRRQIWWLNQLTGVVTTPLHGPLADGAVTACLWRWC